MVFLMAWSTSERKAFVAGFAGTSEVMSNAWAGFMDGPPCGDMYRMCVAVKGGEGEDMSRRA